MYVVFRRAFKMSNSTEEVAPKSKTPKRRRWRRWVIALFILLVLLGGLVAMAPMLASSGTGKSMILAKVNGQLTGKANVDKLDVGWFGHLDVTGVTLNDPQGRQVLAIPSIHRSGGLWDLLRSKQVGSAAGRPAGPGCARARSTRRDPGRTGPAGPGSDRRLGSRAAIAPAHPVGHQPGHS
jgi:hypothetical protein